jgi:hypothetical protein
MQLAAGHYCSLNNLWRAGGTHEAIKTAGGILGTCFGISPSMIEECFCCCWIFPFEAVADLVMGISYMRQRAANVTTLAPDQLLWSSRKGEGNKNTEIWTHRIDVLVGSFPSNWSGIHTRTSVIFFRNDNIRFVLCSWANSARNNLIPATPLQSLDLEL